MSASYVVGQVSGCLFPNKSASGSGSLSALFSTSSTTNTVKFVPAPKVSYPLQFEIPLLLQDYHRRVEILLYVTIVSI